MGIKKFFVDDVFIFLINLIVYTVLKNYWIIESLSFVPSRQLVSYGLKETNCTSSFIKHRSSLFSPFSLPPMPLLRSNVNSRRLKSGTAFLRYNLFSFPVSGVSEAKNVLEKKERRGERGNGKKDFNERPWIKSWITLSVA